MTIGKEIGVAGEEIIHRFPGARSMAGSHWVPVHIGILNNKIGIKRDQEMKQFQFFGNIRF